MAQLSAVRVLPLRSPAAEASRDRAAVFPARPVLVRSAPVDTSPEAATALLMVWRALHAQADVIRAEFDTMPPRRAIDAWSDNTAGFDAVASLAQILGVELRIPEQLRHHAPERALYWAVGRGTATGGT